MSYASHKQVWVDCNYSVHGLLINCVCERLLADKQNRNLFFSFCAKMFLGLENNNGFDC